MLLLLLSPVMVKHALVVGLTLVMLLLYLLLLLLLMVLVVGRMLAVEGRFRAVRRRVVAAATATAAAAVVLHPVGAVHAGAVVAVVACVRRHVTRRQQVDADVHVDVEVVWLHLVLRLLRLVGGGRVVGGVLLVVGGTSAVVVVVAAAVEPGLVFQGSRRRWARFELGLNLRLLLSR